MILDLFALALTLVECILTPTDAPKLPCVWKERRTKECQARADHGQSMVKATVRGGPLSHEVVCFLTTFQFQAVFNVIYSRGCSTSSSFVIKGGSHPHFNTHPISISLSILLRLEVVLQ